MAGVRVGTSQIIFAVFLISGCVAFVNRKKLMPEVFERNRKLKEESFEQAAAFKDAVKKQLEAKQKEN